MAGERDVGIVFVGFDGKVVVDVLGELGETKSRGQARVGLPASPQLQHCVSEPQRFDAPNP